MIAPLIAFLTILVAIAALTYLSVKIVPQGCSYTLQRFGRYIRTLEPGIHFVIPFVDLIGRRVNLRESLLTVPALEFVTSDNIVVRTEAVIFFRVVDAYKAAYEVDDLPEAVANVALANLRAEIGGLSLEGALAQREEMGRRLRSVMEFAAGPWGVAITRVDIKSLNPPSEITHAVAQLLKAEREKRAKVLSAEGAKEAAILRAEGEKQATLRAAEGRRRAATLDAEARERAARAEVHAARSISEAVRRGDVEPLALDYLLGQQHVRALEKLAGGDARPVIVASNEVHKLSIAAVTEAATVAERAAQVPEPEALPAAE